LYLFHQVLPTGSLVVKLKANSSTVYSLLVGEMSGHISFILTSARYSKSNSPCSLRSQTMSNNTMTTWMHGNRNLWPNFQNSWPCYNQQTNCKSHMLLKQKQWWNSQNKEKFTGISQYQNHKYF